MFSLVMVFAVIGFAIFSTAGTGAKPKYRDRLDSPYGFEGKHNEVVLDDEFYDREEEDQRESLRTLEFLRRTRK